MTTAITTTNNSDMQTFSPEQLKRAGELLGCPLDEASVLKALIIQKDTGLSIVRGEISIVPFGGKPTVMINKQGYLSYASRQDDYDGYESGIDEEGGEMVGWCKVYRLTKSRPTSIRIYRKEFEKPNSIWAEKPRYMLEKTAISLALRAAYPILNGTYSDIEIQPQSNRIEPREDDIVVSAVPRADPKYTGPIYTMQQAKTIYDNMKSQGMDVSIFDAAKISTSEYNREMIDADFKRQRETHKAAEKAAEGKSFCPVCGDESMTKDERKMVESLLDTPENLPKDLCKICAQDYIRSQNPEPVAVPEQEKEEDSTISLPFCADCGDKRVLKSEEKISREKYGVPLCRGCYEKRLNADLRKTSEDKTAVQNLVAAAEGDKHKNICSVCGKPMSKAEVDAHNLFSKKGDPLKCRECAKPKSTQDAPEKQAKLV